MHISEWVSGFEYELLQGSMETEVSEVIFDSRKAAPGAVFVCMRGFERDSHDYIPQVLAAGVRVLVTEHAVDVPEDVTVLKTQSGRKALAYLSAARFGHPAEKLFLIGLTGTKGKTTTAHMIKRILTEDGCKAGMIGTNGIFIGEERFPSVNTTPGAYELNMYFDMMVRAGCTACVMEVSSQALKTARVEGLVFDIALFTNISPDHIGKNEHDSFEEYLSCKKKIFSQCKKAIANADDEHFQEIAKDLPCRLLTYTADEKKDAVWKAEDICCTKDGQIGVTMKFKNPTAETDLFISIPGRFNAYNGLAAAAVADAMGIGMDAVKRALADIQVNGRMELVGNTGDYSVLVDYAHNAVSLESLLATLREYSPGRLVCLFGCGGNRAKDRRFSMGEISGKMADLTIITADNSRFEKTEDIMADIRSAIEKTSGKYIEIADRREAIRYALENALPGDIIAVAGKGHEDYQEIEGVRQHFSDREVIEEELAKLGRPGRK